MIEIGSEGLSKESNIIGVRNAQEKIVDQVIGTRVFGLFGFEGDTARRGDCRAVSSLEIQQRSCERTGLIAAGVIVGLPAVIDEINAACPGICLGRTWLGDRAGGASGLSGGGEGGRELGGGGAGSLGSSSILGEVVVVLVCPFGAAGMAGSGPHVQLGGNACQHEKDEAADHKEHELAFDVGRFGPAVKEEEQRSKTQNQSRQNKVLRHLVFNAISNKKSNRNQ